MSRRRRGGTTRQLGDFIDDTLDRAGDVEYDLRRAARKAVENRDDDRDDDRDDRDGRTARDGRDDDRDWDDIEEILEELWDVVHRLRDGQDRRRARSRPRDQERGSDPSGGGDQLAGQLARLNRRVEELSRQVNTDAREG